MPQRRVPFLLVAIAALLASGASADEKKKKEGGDDPFADLFGDSLAPEKGSMDELREASKGVKQRGGGPALKPREAEFEEGAKVELRAVFAAARIRVHPKRGCEPADRDKTKITEIIFDEVPNTSPGFAVCLTMASKSGRQMRITTSIVGPRNRRVGRAESVVSFRGKPAVDHVMVFPDLEFKEAGQHYYVVEVEGEKIGRLPLVNVRLDR